MGEESKEVCINAARDQAAESDRQETGISDFIWTPRNSMRFKSTAARSPTFKKVGGIFASTEIRRLSSQPCPAIEDPTHDSIFSSAMEATLNQLDIYENPETSWPVSEGQHTQLLVEELSNICRLSPLGLFIPRSSLETVSRCEPDQGPVSSFQRILPDFARFSRRQQIVRGAFDFAVGGLVVAFAPSTVLEMKTRSTGSEES
jgi:hypothetical protein